MVLQPLSWRRRVFLYALMPAILGACSACISSHQPSKGMPDYNALEPIPHSHPPLEESAAATPTQAAAGTPTTTAPTVSSKPAEPPKTPDDFVMPPPPAVPLPADASEPPLPAD